MSVRIVENCRRLDKEELTGEPVEDCDTAEHPFSEPLNKAGSPTEAITIRNTTAKRDGRLRTLMRLNPMTPLSVKTLPCHKNLRAGTRNDFSHTDEEENKPKRRDKAEKPKDWA
jgi:hypothetical protein